MAETPSSSWASTALRVFVAFAAVHFLVAGFNIKIGLDYDDTLSFSTPAFSKAFAAVNEQGIKPMSPEFWQIVNSNHHLEEPRWGVTCWMALAKAFGFDIVIITVRLPVDADELVAKWDWLHDGFIFTRDKALVMKRHRYLCFIGDSDSDMEECRKAGIWAIRARRSSKSSYKENYSPGKYGEWILPFTG
ncbi:MAG: hypothetical protein HYT79_01815 [Elusimicrobia bacterium]|nr:hypothetical protein [Elusimicrobiota bacterium]